MIVNFWKLDFGPLRFSLAASVGIGLADLAPTLGQAKSTPHLIQAGLYLLHSFIICSVCPASGASPSAFILLMERYRNTRSKSRQDVLGSPPTSQFLRPKFDRTHLVLSRNSQPLRYPSLFSHQAYPSLTRPTHRLRGIPRPNLRLWGNQPDRLKESP